jgi:uncharacterized ParB-like nuclease family protein
MWANGSGEDEPITCQGVLTKDKDQIYALGNCHRYSPVKGNSGTREDYWCGDFEAK